MAEGKKGGGAWKIALTVLLVFGACLGALATYDKIQTVRANRAAKRAAAANPTEPAA